MGVGEITELKTIELKQHVEKLGFRVDEEGDITDKDGRKLILIDQRKTFAFNTYPKEFQWVKVYAGKELIELATAYSMTQISER